MRVLLLYRQNELVKPEGEDNYLHTVLRVHANSSPGCSVRFLFVKYVNRVHNRPAWDEEGSGMNETLVYTFRAARKT